MGALASKLKGCTKSGGTLQDYEPKISTDSDESESLRRFDAEDLESYPLPSLMERLRQLEQLAHVQQFQSSPSPDGYTDYEVQQWRHLLIGRRLFQGGEPLVLQNLRDQIAFAQTTFERKEMYTNLGLRYDPKSLAMDIANAIRDYRQEILQRRSDMDFDCENLPTISAVDHPGVCLDYSIHVDRLMVKANSHGIVTSVRKG